MWDEYDDNDLNTDHENLAVKVDFDGEALDYWRSEEEGWFYND